MIDLHCHLLPGIDDGPETISDSIELARACADDGTKVISATPHCRHDHPRVRVDQLEEGCEALRSAFVDAGLEIQVVRGGEVDLDWAAETPDDSLATVSLGGAGYILLETPYGPLTSTFEDRVFDLALRGFRIVLAHPENNSSFHEEPRRLGNLVDRGITLQVTARSLTDSQRRTPRGRFARRLLDEGKVGIIASDAHSAGPFRPPLLRRGLDVARELIGPDADRLVTDNPAAVLAGGEPPSPVTPLQRPRRWFGRRP